MVFTNCICISPLFRTREDFMQALERLDAELAQEDHRVPIIGDGLPVTTALNDQIQEVTLATALDNVTNGIESPCFDFVYLVDKIVLRIYADEDEYRNDEINIFDEIYDDFNEEEINYNVAEMPHITNQ